jgi:NAD(P)-dependent dehydrogenase (short-subunit alcohol dehydrogenase family)
VDEPFEKLWDEEKAFDCDGEYFQSVAAISEPKPLQRPRPPIVSAGAGIGMLTKVAAEELTAVGIRVNAVAPGIVNTGITAEAMKNRALVERFEAKNPFGRVGQPTAIADVIIFLSNDKSGWITGQTLAVDGETSLRVEPNIAPDELYSREGLLAQFESD